MFSKLFSIISSYFLTFCILKEFTSFQLPRGVEADALGQLSDVGDLDAGDGPAGEGPAGDGAADADLPTDRYLDQDQFLSQLERGDVKKLKTPKCPAGGSKRMTATEEEDVLKDIRDSMKVSTELLSQLVHKSDQGPREPFITYLSETLRTLPEDQYHVVMKHIISLINNLPHPAATFGPLGSVNLSGVADVANSSFKSIGNLNTPRLVSPRGDGEPD